MRTTARIRPGVAGVLALLFASAAASAEVKVVAYVPNWIDLPAFARTIDYDSLTHINIAFENPADDGGLSFHPQDDALVERAHANRVKVLVSIGGGAAAGNKALRERYFRLLADANRAAFVAKIAEYVTKHDFDGLDVDIEGPSINADYGAFVRDLAEALKPRGKLLTAALSKGYGGDKVPGSVFGHFDFVNIMAYDAAGPWNPRKPGQHSSMEHAREAVAYWLNRGLPKSKAVLGVPFYGYGFGDAFRNRDYPYKAIVDAYPGAENKDQAGSTIWYNGVPTVRAKTKYVLDEGLAGVMIWSLDSDVKGERSLLKAIHETLGAGSAVRPNEPGP